MTANPKEPSMDQRVFGPYYGTPPEQQPHPAPHPAPPEPLTRTERRTRFFTRRRRRRPTTHP